MLAQVHKCQAVELKTMADKDNRRKAREEALRIFNEVAK